jgi:cytidylate kinase
MTAFSSIERAGAYLNVQLTHHGAAGNLPAAPFVTISRESGTGGSTLARLLLERLAQEPGIPPWSFYSGNLIEEMLRMNDLPSYLGRFLPEDRISEFNASVGEIVGLHPNLWSLVAKTNELIRQLARAGHVILLGRGANFATANISHGLHVRLVGSTASRAARTAQWLSLPPDIARAYNALRDAARRRYVRSIFDAEITEPSAYNLMFNVERVSIATIVDTLARFVALEQGACRRKAESLAGTETETTNSPAAANRWQAIDLATT